MKFWDSLFKLIQLWLKSRAKIRQIKVLYIFSLHFTTLHCVLYWRALQMHWCHRFLKCFWNFQAFAILTSPPPHTFAPNLPKPGQKSDAKRNPAKMGNSRKEKSGKNEESAKNEQNGQNWNVAWRTVSAWIWTIWATSCPSCLPCWEILLTS